ncbi:MAG: hypothetical protein WCT54_04525 [Patescibacteria group bacterium]
MLKKSFLIFTTLLIAGFFGVVHRASATLVVTPVRNSKAADYQRPASDSFVSALVIDVNSNKVLYEYDADRIWVPASLTKLMTSQIFAPQQTNWNKVVSLKAEDEVGGGRLRVNTGAQLSVTDVMFSTITASANNTATAMRRLTSLTPTQFISQMNSRAKELGCKVADFYDASGMDPSNKITARDISIIAKSAWSTPQIKRAADTASYTFTIRNTSEKKTIKNTNELLLDPNNGLYVTAGKTGYLEESLNNLVYTVRPSQPSVKQELMVVVLGAPTKAKMFDVAEELTKWAWKAYDWSGETVEVATDDLRDGSLIKLASAPEVWYVWKEKKYHLPDEVFLNLYFKGKYISIVDKTSADGLGDGGDYKFDDGALVKTGVDSSVYLVQGGDLRPIASGEAFESMGYKWDQIVTVPARVLESYPKAEIITLAVK